MKTYLLAGMMLTFPLVAVAYPPAGIPTVPQQDVRETRDDRRDEAELRALLNQFNQARSRRDYRTLRLIDARIQEAIAREIRETEHELALDSREARLSQREIKWNNSRHERAEARDDIRDLRRERRTLAQLEDIDHSFRSLMGRFDWFAMRGKRDVIESLIQIENREQRENRQERIEDRNDAAFSRR
jgi:hypothetical protein